jgi:hypothetical protein
VREERAVKYMLLIYGNEEAFSSVGAETLAEIIRETDALNPSSWRASSSSWGSRLGSLCLTRMGVGRLAVDLRAALLLGPRRAHRGPAVEATAWVGGGRRVGPGAFVAAGSVR